MNKINNKDTENFEILKNIQRERSYQRKLAHELGYSLGKLKLTNELRKRFN